jgi:hypothetical protein
VNIDTFTELESKLALRRSAVLFVTLWMTWRAFTWAAAYASSIGANNESMLGAAAMIAAVTAPISMLQAAVFKAYIESKQ